MNRLVSNYRLIPIIRGRTTKESEYPLTEGTAILNYYFKWLSGRASEIGDPQAPTVRSRLPVPARRQTRAESLPETTTEAATPDNGQIKDAGTSSLPKRLPVFPTLNAGNPNNVSWPSISLSVNASHSILMSNVLDHSTTSTTSAKISCQMGVPGLSVEDLKI